MHYASQGPHRAFMGAGFTICVILVLGLVMGWRWHFQSLEARARILDLANKAESRAKQLERLGLRAPTAGDAANQGAIVPPETGGGVIAVESASTPSKSTIEALPLENSGNTLALGENLLKQYWGTEKWKDRVPFVYDAKRVASLMEDFYEHQGGIDPQPGDLISKGRYRIDGVEILHFSYRSDRPLGMLEIALRRSGDGKFLMDWESFVGYSEKSFPQLQRERSTQPVLLRVFAKLDDFYGYEFSDRNKFLSIKLTSESGQHSFFGFAERDSDLGDWLGEQLDTGGLTNPTKGLAIWVAFPNKAQSDNCLWIKQVVANRWLLLPK